jgi:hypothetical protein
MISQHQRDIESAALLPGNKQTDSKALDTSTPALTENEKGTHNSKVARTRWFLAYTMLHNPVVSVVYSLSKINLTLNIVRSCANIG